MIIVQSPLRISFIGGGSDIPQFYHRSLGATLSTTINKYIYVCINPKFDNKIRASYSITEIVGNVNQLKHTRIKACMKHTGAIKGIEIVTIADIPSRGTGLGSSSSLTVGLLKALNAYQGKTISENELAKQACFIEINKLREPIGKQDQYIAAFGGFRFIEYLPNDSVKVNYLQVSQNTIAKLEKTVLLFYTGIDRSTKTILKNQVNNLTKKINIDSTKKMVELAFELKKQLEKGNIKSFGQLLHQAWLIKKTLATNISNGLIDNMYKTAMDNGATGGKLLGAGGGGFLLVVADPSKHKQIKISLNKYQVTNINFEQEGCKILFMNKN